MVNKTMKKMMKNTTVVYTLIIVLIGLLILLGILLTNKKQEGFRYFTPRRYPRLSKSKPTFQRLERLQKPTFKPSSKLPLPNKLPLQLPNKLPPQLPNKLTQQLPNKLSPQPPNKLIRKASLKNMKHELKRLKEQGVPNNELIKFRKNYFKKNIELRPSQINEKKN